MEIEVKILKGIPVKQLDFFKDKVVYYTAMATREYVKGRNGYPYLTGKLMQEEIASPIVGSNKEYSLLGGVKYAKRVYNYDNVKWTNQSTIPHWYYTAFRMKSSVLTTNAVIRTLKELKK